MALSRIQAFYRLDTFDVAMGKLANKESSARLTWKDCVLLSNFRLSSEAGTMRQISGQPENALAIEWREAALKYVRYSISELNQNLLHEI